MLSVKMDGSPAVGPRVGLVNAAQVFLFDGYSSGDAHGRVPSVSRPSKISFLEFANENSRNFNCTKMSVTRCGKPAEQWPNLDH